MSFNYLYIIAGCILVLILLIQKVLAKNAFIESKRFILHIILFLICVFLLGFHFYEKNLTVGYIALAMGSVAFGKYMYDLRKK